MFCWQMTSFLWLRHTNDLWSILKSRYWLRRCKTLPLKPISIQSSTRPSEQRKKCSGIAIKMCFTIRAQGGPVCTVYDKPVSYVNSDIVPGLHPCSSERVSRVSSALTACGEEWRGRDGPLALPSELISCQRFPRETVRAGLNQMWESQPPQLCLCRTQDHIMHTDHCSTI